MRGFNLFAVLLLAACGTPAEKAAPPVAFAKLSPDPVKHGARVSVILGCSGCHGKDLTGEDWSEAGYGRLWTANLTVSAAGYSDAQLKNVITRAKKPDGTPLWDMPSHLFSQLADADLDALVAFIRSKPPTGEAHPPPTFGPILKAEMAKGVYFSSAVKVECHNMDLRGGKAGSVTGDRQISGSLAPTTTRILCGCSAPVCPPGNASSA